MQRYKVAYIASDDAWVVLSIDGTAGFVVGKASSEDAARSLANVLSEAAAGMVHFDKKGFERVEAKPTFPLEKIYAAYPRRVGKTAGLARLRTQIKTQADFDAVLTAVNKYAAYVKANGVDEQYIKHFSSWVTHWRDWADADVDPGTTAEDFKPRHSLEELANMLPL